MHIHLVALLLAAAVLTNSCLSSSRSQLAHEDRPNERGADNAEPWHFHTGLGVAQMEFEDQRTLKVVKRSVSCDPRSEDAITMGCMERVYFFSPEDIKIVANKTRQLLDARATSDKNLRDGSAILISGMLTTAYFASAAPDFTVSKVSAGILIAAVGVSYAIAIRADYTYRQALAQLTAIDHFLEAEQLFVQQCKHVRKDFLVRAAQLGIVYQFPRNGGQFIPAKDFQETRATDLQLYEQARDWARQHNTTTAEAFNSYFRNQCGQLPLVNLTPEDEMFMDGIKYPVPVNMQQRLADLNDVLKLRSGKPTNLESFSADDLRDAEQQNSINQFLINFQSDLKRFSDHGSAKNKAALAKFRETFDEVYLKPASYYFWEPKPYTIENGGGTNKLVIHATRKGSFYESYKINLKSVYKDVIGLE